jgi:pyrroline-5-carboxylate reductase
MTSTTFIGAGNIAQALMGGYLASDSEAKITASDPYAAQLEKLPSAIQRCENNHDAVESADVVVLCVKPNMMEQICKDLGSALTSKLTISVAAGITASAMSSWLGAESAIIRCMPNTPALVNQGMTGLYANEHVTEAQKQKAANILGSVGRIQWFETESELDAVTAVSGSGPAYFFLVMEAMQKAAIGLGLDPTISRDLVLQTALGAAQMAQQSELSTEQLRINVTSPGGTTEAALNELVKGGLAQNFEKAIEAAFKRSVDLSKG